MRFIGKTIGGMQTSISNDGLIYVVSDDLYIENVTQDKDIIFKTNDGGTATEVMRIDGSTSNVGIGTSSPNKRLDVRTNGTGDGFRLATSSNNSFAEIINGNSESFPYGKLNMNYGGTVPLTIVALSNAMELSGGFTTGGKIIFRTATTERMRLTDTGLGIGTSSPSHKLTVLSGTTNVTSVFKSEDNQAWISVQDDDSGTYGALFGTDTDAGHSIVLADQGAVKRLVIDGSGNVGIGTTSPTTKLDVVGTGKFSEKLTISDNQYLSWSSNSRIVANSSYMQFQVAATDKMRILADGNVGIGTTSPASKLHVAGTVQVGVDDTGHDVIFYGATSGRSMLWDESYDGLILSDNTKLQLGSSTGYGDLQLLHDGTNSYVKNHFGDLYIMNNADDKDILFQSDNGSGGVSTYFYLDGSLTETNFQVRTRHVDNAQAWFGNSGDLRIYHNGTNSNIENFNGTLQIVQNVDDGDISFLCDNGSGGTTAYLTLDGSSKRVTMPDGVRLAIGNGNDLQLYHNSANSFIENNYNGNLNITNYVDDADIIFSSDDGSGGTTPYLTLDGSLLRTQAAKDILFLDDIAARFGNSGDLLLTHDGSNSYIQNHTSDLYIQNTADDKDIIFQCDDGSGGLTEYLRIDGGSEEVIFSKPIVTAETQIKVLPHQFMSNEDGGANKSAQFRDDTIIGVRTSADDAELYAFVEIPYGKTATNVTVYGNDTNLAVNVYESDINAGALTDKTPEAGCRVGAVCDITDVAYSTTNYLAIKVTTTSYTNDIVYGAVVTIT